MKDWLFFPLMTIIAGAMIYIAMSWGEGAQPINPEEGFVLQGAELQYLTKSPGTNADIVGVDHMVMSADFRADQQPSQGVFATLGADYAKAYGGRKLELTIRARAAQSQPAGEFQIAFLTLPPVKGSFTWRNFAPTSEFQDFKVTTTLGSFDVDNPVLYLGVWPDAKGKGRAIEVERYEVRPMD